MTTTPHDMLQEALLNAFPHGRLRTHDVVASTMDLARAEAEDGAPEGTLVLAGEQRQGRGRRGRGWDSPPGGLWASLVLRPTDTAPQTQPSCFSVLAAVGLADGLRERFRVPAAVKWPNDLMIHRRKLGGTLVEMTFQRDRPAWLIVGAGLNVNNAAPKDARVPATSLSRELGMAVEVSDVAAAMVEGIASAYRTFQADGFAPIQHEWWPRVTALGEHVWILDGPDKRHVQVEGLAEDGRLQVRTDGERRLLASEETTLEWED
ncbi:MAG: biotin--[acetyl-CoA-carboxylase] ligase [Candidatus Bipolaricaulia bacterium]